MPTFLSDPSPSLYLLLIVAAVVAAFVCYRQQTRKSCYVASVFGGVLLLVFTIDVLFESPREEATRKVKAMAAAATAHDADKFVEHVSPSFSVGGGNRDKLKTTISSGIIQQYDVRAAVWDFGRDTFKEISDGEIEIGFMSKGESLKMSGFVLRYTRARFVRDPDGQWRLKDVKFYNPAENGLNAEDPIPGFP